MHSQEKHIPKLEPMLPLIWQVVTLVNFFIRPWFLSFGQLGYLLVVMHIDGGFDGRFAGWCIILLVEHPRVGGWHWLHADVWTLSCFSMYFAVPNATHIAWAIVDTLRGTFEAVCAHMNLIYPCHIEDPWVLSSLVILWDDLHLFGGLTCTWQPYDSRGGILDEMKGWHKWLLKNYCLKGWSGNHLVKTLMMTS